jgi:sarcosine oxidase delta subunit
MLFSCTASTALQVTPESVRLIRIDTVARFPGYAYVYKWENHRGVCYESWSKSASDYMVGKRLFVLRKQ